MGAAELENDEIKSFLDARYLTSTEACWRIFGMDLHNRTISVERLPIHLPNQQRVQFDPNQPLDQEQLSQLPLTKLQKFFEYCQDNECNFTYARCPEFLVWKTKTKEWSKRKRDFAIGRIYVSSLREGEIYFLRLLLHHVKKPTLFKFLKTYNTIVYSTFKEACKARDLLLDDIEWDHCLEQASLSQMPAQLRELFVIILVFGSPPNVRHLFIKYSQVLSDDFCRETGLSHDHPAIHTKILISLENLFNITINI